MRKLCFSLPVLLLAAMMLPAAGAATVVFEAPLSPSGENPPVTGLSGNGFATVTIRTITGSAGEIVSAAVDFDVTYNLGVETTIFLMHIHRGAEGVNGPVVIDSGLNPDLDSIQVEPGGSGRIVRNVTVTGAAGLQVVAEILANPAGFYVNAHSPANPGGFMRGQLRPSNAGMLQQLSADVGALQTLTQRIARSLSLVVP